MRTRVAIGLGSNLGDRHSHIASGIQSLSMVGDVVSVSALYETEAQGGPEQGSFLNAVAVADTDLPPRKLLEALLSIEQDHGRRRRERWGPRTLDLDILIYGRENIDETGLRVPHPELTNRRFALQPLVEAWPGVVLPDGTLLETFLDSVSDQGVDQIEKAPVQVTFPTWAPLALFLMVGLAAVVLWWVLGIFL